SPPRPFRPLRMAERGTPDLNFESGPVHSGIGSKIGYRHHQPRRSAFIPDAKEIPATSQVLNGKKMELRLRKNHSPRRHGDTEKTTRAGNHPNVCKACVKPATEFFL